MDTIYCTDDVEEGMIGYLPSGSNIYGTVLAEGGTSFFVARYVVSAGALLWQAFPSS